MRGDPTGGMVVGCGEGVNLEGPIESTMVLEPPELPSPAVAAAAWLRARTPALPWWTRAGFALLPPGCLLCGGEGDLGAVDLCSCCLETLPFAAPQRSASRAPFLYRDPVGSGLRALKFHGDLRPARLFGALLAADIGAAVGAAAGVAGLVPVPLHRARRAERGFNQAEAIARHAARWLGLPVRTDWLRRVRATRPQTELRGAERRRNLAGAFTATPALHAAAIAARASARPLRVVLVDDVLTTGATVAAARAALVAAGVATVQVWAVARGAAPQAARSP